MSADNGIYILKTKDQYRVAHLQAIDNIHWSIVNRVCEKLVPTRVVEMCGKCKYTRDEDMAFYIAQRWERSLPVCEYGVNVIAYNKTWKHIVEDAKSYAEKELTELFYLQEHLHPENKSYYERPMNELRDIICGKYDTIKMPRK